MKTQVSYAWQRGSLSQCSSAAGLHGGNLESLDGKTELYEVQPTFHTETHSVARLDKPDQAA